MSRKPAEHGTYTKYARWKCKCDLCLAEGRRLSRRMAKERALGRCNMVDAEPVRRYVKALIHSGMTTSEMEHLSGVNRTSIRVLLGEFANRPASIRVRNTTAQKLMQIRPGTRPDSGLVDGTGARRRVQALVAFGYPEVELVRRLNGKSRNLQMLRGERITAESDRRIRELFSELQLVPGPSTAARARGRRKGWPLPFEWDEDTIDDPAAKPARARWKPSSSKAERREQVADLTARGYSTEEIAVQLGVDARTVVRDRSVAS